MTTPSDREVFLNEVREAIEASLDYLGELLDVDIHSIAIDGTRIDTTELAQAAIDAMARRLGPEF